MTIATIMLGYKINQTTHFFYYIHFILVLEFLGFIKKKEATIFNFLDTNFLAPKIGYRYENHLLLRTAYD